MFVGKVLSPPACHQGFGLDNHWAFAAILLLNGLGMGLFTSPNRAEVMNSLPNNARGAGAGMTATFQNSAQVLSIGIFFSLMIVGLASSLPASLHDGLIASDERNARRVVEAEAGQLSPI